MFFIVYKEIYSIMYLPTKYTFGANTFCKNKTIMFIITCGVCHINEQEFHYHPYSLCTLVSFREVVLKCSRPLEASFIHA